MLWRHFSASGKDWHSEALSGLRFWASGMNVSDSNGQEQHQRKRQTGMKIMLESMPLVEKRQRLFLISRHD